MVEALKHPYWGRCASPVLPYLVLLRAGFTVPRAVTSRAVRSYRTFSPLPTLSRRYLFCGTFHGLAPPRCYLAPCPKEPGLSSATTRVSAIAWPAPVFPMRDITAIDRPPRASCFSSSWLASLRFTSDEKHHARSRLALLISRLGIGLGQLQHPSVHRVFFAARYRSGDGGGLFSG